MDYENSGLLSSENDIQRYETDVPFWPVGGEKAKNVISEGMDLSNGGVVKRRCDLQTPTPYLLR